MLAVLIAETHDKPTWWPAGATAALAFFAFIALAALRDATRRSDMRRWSPIY
jgi:hypothetical protein